MSLTVIDPAWVVNVVPGVLRVFVVGFLCGRGGSGPLTPPAACPKGAAASEAAQPAGL